MSEWVKIRDTIVNALQLEKVTEEAKQNFTLWLLSSALPLAKESATNFIAQTTEQARTEKGWVKLRDMVVLPAIISGTLWIVETALKKSVEAIEK
jgi:hypothetical protein